VSATLTAAASSPATRRRAWMARRRSAGSRCQGRGGPAPGQVTAPSPCCPTAAAATPPVYAPAPARRAPDCGSGGGGGRRGVEQQGAAVKTRPRRLSHAAGFSPDRPPRRHGPSGSCRHCRRRFGAHLSGGSPLAGRCPCSAPPGLLRPSSWPPCWGSGRPYGLASRTRRRTFRWPWPHSCPPARTRVGEASDPAAAVWAARRGVAPPCRAAPPCVPASCLQLAPLAPPQVDGQARLPRAQACCRATRHPGTRAWLPAVE
jgi:hypothetical protein